MSFDLTGQFISDTYGRVVQYVSGALYDGLGSPIPFSNSLATTGSNIFIGDQTISGSLLISGSIPYALAYFDTNSSLRTLPTPINLSGDTFAVFSNESNSWLMTHTIDGGTF